MNELDTLVSPCPACRKPRAIGDSESARCDACGSTSPVSPELLQAARTYRAARANAPLQLRQASDIEALVTRGQGYALRFRLAAGLLGAPLVVAFALGLSMALQWNPERTRDHVVYAPALMLPLLVLLATGLLVGWRLHQRNTAVQSLLWARPLADVPGGFACRMCGGPLTASATSKRVSTTCPYCRSENILGSEISRRAAKLALSDYATNATRVLAALHFDERPWVAIGLMAAPAIVLLVLPLLSMAVVAKLSKKRGPLDPSVAYVAMQCPSDGVSTIYKASAKGEVSCRDPQESAVTTPFDPGTLRTARLTRCDAWSPEIARYSVDDSTFRAVDVYRDGFGRNHIMIDLGFGVLAPCLIDGLTLRVEPLTPAK